MSTPPSVRGWCVAATLVAAVLAAACATHHAAAPPAAAAPSPATAPAPSDPQSPGKGASEASLVAQGEGRFRAYKCYECHGARGEGSDDAPDLTGTRLNAEEIARFLQNPSVHARGEGMPSIPADSPDLQPLVAFVLSLKRTR